MVFFIFKEEELFESSERKCICLIRKQGRDGAVGRWWLPTVVALGGQVRPVMAGNIIRWSALSVFLSWLDSTSRHVVFFFSISFSDSSNAHLCEQHVPKNFSLSSLCLGDFHKNECAQPRVGARLIDHFGASLAFCFLTVFLGLVMMLMLMFWLVDSLARFIRGDLFSTNWRHTRGC